MAEELRINGENVIPGSSVTLELPLPELYTRTPMTMPVQVRRGKRPGPCLFVCAAVHGDELNGIEIIRRLMKRRALSRVRGTIIAVPIVNVYGVIERSRYLPDRRDLNRSFPGSGRGSLAARVADLFMTEIVARCTHGIDLHTGAIEGYRCADAGNHRIIAFQLFSLVVNARTMRSNVHVTLQRIQYVNRVLAPVAGLHQPPRRIQ